MTANHEFDAATRASLEKISKLLSLAARNPSQEEAATATAKAQALLAALNLDMAAVEAVAGIETKRADQLLKGGRFVWQRDLWESVAELNFTFYFTADEFVPDETGPSYQLDGNRWIKGRYEPRHRLVGRVVNIQATRVMAEYLEGAVDRLARERCREGKISLRSGFAFTFRRGICDEVITAIYARRRDMLSEETRKQREAEEAALAQAGASVSTATALTLATYTDREADANTDFMFGAGTSARWAEERAAQARADAEAEAAYIKWAARHPDKARELEEERERRKEEKAERDSERRLGSGGETAYWMGRKAGKAISLDPQAAGPSVAGALPARKRDHA